jgi:hypothetical protein
LIYRLFGSVAVPGIPVFEEKSGVEEIKGFTEADIDVGIDFENKRAYRVHRFVVRLNIKILRKRATNGRIDIAKRGKRVKRETLLCLVIDITESSDLPGASDKTVIIFIVLADKII